MLRRNSWAKRGEKVDKKKEGSVSPREIHSPPDTHSPPGSPPARLSSPTLEQHVSLEAAAGVAADDEKSPLQLFLERKHISDLASKWNEIVVVEKDQTVDSVIKTMAEKNLLSVPVYSAAQKKYAGMFDVLDLVVLALDVLEKKDDPAAALLTTPVGKVVNFSTVDVLFPMDSEISLYHLVEVFTRGLHRVPMINTEGEVANIVSQSALIREIAEHPQVLGRAADKTFDALIHIARKGLISVQTNELALDAFRLIAKNSIDSVAVLSESGALVGQISAENLRGLNPVQIFEYLNKPVSEVMRSGAEFQTCGEMITLGQVVHQLCTARVHRLWVVDAAKDNQPLGVISLTDVMKALMLSQNLAPVLKARRRSTDIGRLRAVQPHHKDGRDSKSPPGSP